MGTIIYSDPHIGLKLSANTTPASRKRLEKFQWQALDDVQASREEGDSLICGGDFFHHHRVDEDSLLRSIPWAKAHDLIMSGNHDIVNEAYKSGSMDLLRYVCADKKDLLFSHTEFGEAVSNSVWRDGIAFHTIPHCTTQHLFDHALKDLVHQRRQQDSAYPHVNYLILHCNYDNPLATKDTELNLSKSTAKWLTEYFDYVVLGHEHNFRTDLNDRLIVVGNTYPTNFGDIADKFCLRVDAQGNPELCDLWNKDKFYQEVHCQSLEDVRPQVQWLRIKGQCEPGHLHEISKQVKGLWKNLPEVVAIKLDVDIKTKSAEYDYSSGSSNLKQLIAEELKGEKDLLTLWESLIGEES